MKQIVLLIRNAAKNDFGGAETYQVSLAGVLQSKQYHPIIVSGSSRLLQYASQQGVPAIKGWWWSRQNWSAAWILLTPLYMLWQVMLTAWYVALIIRTHASILHIQSKDDFIAATIAGRITRRRVIWTDHMDLRYIFMNISRPFHNPVGKMVFYAAHLAHSIILISDNEYRLVTKQFKDQGSLKKQIRIVKNGVIDRKYIYTHENQSKMFVFCLASRIVVNKGIGEAIEAFAALKNKAIHTRDIRLHIYGDGPDAGYFKKKAEQHKEIIFFGHQSDVLQKVNEADVFMLPSYQEGFSIALLEATMLQKAIIATNVDSNPELIVNRKSGLLVDPRDVTGLKNAMEELYADDALRTRLARSARRQYETNFNLEFIVSNEIIPLYEGHASTN